jgi:hypothetical protein
MNAEAIPMYIIYAVYHFKYYYRGKVIKKNSFRPRKL